MDALTHMLGQANKLEKAGAEHGWSVTTEDEEIDGKLYLHCNAIRGQEEIYIWWVDKNLTEAPTYKLAGHEIKLRNASACVQQMAKPPDYERAARKTKKKQQQGWYVEALEPDPDSLPWHYLPDPTDAEILKACYARTIVWINQITERAETDVIVRSPDAGRRLGNFNSENYFISVSSKGRKIINFLGIFGYRAVALETVLRIGTSGEAADRATKAILKQAAAEEEDKQKKWNKVKKDVV